MSTKVLFYFNISHKAVNDIECVLIQNDRFTIRPLTNRPLVKHPIEEKMFLTVHETYNLCTKLYRTHYAASATQLR